MLYFSSGRTVRGTKSDDSATLGRFCKLGKKVIRLLTCLVLAAGPGSGSKEVERGAGHRCDQVRHLQGAGQGHPPRAARARTSKVLLQAGREEDQGGWRRSAAGGLSWTAAMQQSAL